MGASSDPHRFTVTVKVNPGSSRQKSVWRGDHLKVNVTAPPEDGRANDELINYIAELFDLNQADVSIVSGERSNRKTLELCNLDRESLKQTIRSLSS